jgi:hypothetical protein
MSDLELTVAKSAFDQIWRKIVANYRLDEAGTEQDGRLTYTYDIKAHLADGRLIFNGPSPGLPRGSIEVRELDIVWDRIYFAMSYDLDEICTPGGCVWTDPLTGDCGLEIPQVCIFGGSSDIAFDLSIPSFRSEFSFEGKMETFVRDGKWNAKIVPVSVDIDPIDLADTIGDIFKRSFESALDNALPGGAAGSTLRQMIGGIEFYIRKVLDFDDDLVEYIEALLNVDIEIMDYLFWKRKLTQYFADNPFVILPENYILLPRDGALAEVPIPLSSFAISFSPTQAKMNLGIRNP